MIYKTHFTHNGGIKEVANLESINLLLKGDIIDVASEWSTLSDCKVIEASLIQLTQYDKYCKVMRNLRAVSPQALLNV